MSTEMKPDGTLLSDIDYPYGLQPPLGTDCDSITLIETFRVRPRWLFVRVETKKGYVGWGEATLEGHSEAVEGAFKDFTDRFVGWNPANIEDICTFFTGSK